MPDLDTTAALRTQDDIAALRLQLLSNGYQITRNRDKRTFQKGWPSTVVDEGEVARWSRRFKRDTATGIRVEDGLAVIDLDIDDNNLIARISNAVYDAIPELGDPNVPLLVRSGKGAKEAWFVRTDEIFSRIHSRAWVAPGKDVDDGAHRVEIFGGASPRQFGSFGPHTVTPDGVVAVSYAWADRSPADTPKSELPVLTKKQFFLIADIVERELEAAGWSVVAKTTKGENDVSRVYDLTEEMLFDVDTGARLSLLELRELAASAGEHTIRCSAAWLEGPSAKRTDRCIVSLAQNGGVAIWESSSSVTHLEATLKPRDFGSEINRIAEKLKEIDERKRNQIKSSDRAVTAATKMLATYAFCPNQQLGVVPIYTTSMESGMGMQTFRTLMMPNCDEELGPKGGRKVINPVDIWASSERRITVQGLRLRPDKPRPMFEDERGKWINVYTPPFHGETTGGSAEIGMDFFKQVVPNDVERVWFLQWLAFKYRHPWIPGPAVVLVAHARYGTGRGTLGDLMKKLFGISYVREIAYAMVAGRTYQSQYTDWAADQLMIVVNESAETESGGSYQTKHNTYEHLKSLIEPNMIERTFISKTRSAFKAMACASYLIATNHADALPIPEGDRRFAVLTSGEPRDFSYWELVRTWMDGDANIAAFAEALLAVDLTGYSPYVAPPQTEGKRAMIDSAKSDLDRGLETAVAAFPVDVMLIDQVLDRMRGAKNEYGYEYPDRWEAIARRLIASRLYRVGVPESTNWQIKIGHRKLAVYARTSVAAKNWRTSDRLREEVLKANVEGTVEGPSNIIALQRSLKKARSLDKSLDKSQSGDEPTN